jgi:hypothetical protein
MRAGPAWLVGDDHESVAATQRSSDPGAAGFAGIGTYCIEPARAEAA